MSSFDKKKISIIVPVYNERKTIKKIIKAIKKSYVKNYTKEIIIVDDYSTDGTVDILKNEIEEMVSKVIYHKKNQGKGACMRDALKVINGEIVIIQDADLEYDPREYLKLLQPIFDGKADVVYGSRFLGMGPHRIVYFWHKVGNLFLTLLSNMFSNLDLTDMETGYKVFRAKFIKNISIKEKRFGFEPEITAKIAKTSARIYEVGISYFGRTYKEGKKINWKDGISTIICIFKYNLNLSIIKIVGISIIIFLVIFFTKYDISLIRKGYKIYNINRKKSEINIISSNHGAFMFVYPYIIKIKKFCASNNIKNISLNLNEMDNNRKSLFYYRIVELLLPEIHITSNSNYVLKMKGKNYFVESLNLYNKKVLLYKFK